MGPITAIISNGHASKDVIRVAERTSIRGSNRPSSLPLDRAVMVGGFSAVILIDHVTSFLVTPCPPSPFFVSVLYV